MIEVLRIQEVNKQIADEAAHLEEVKAKIEIIKKVAAILKKERNDIYHDCVILSGGYYMFQDGGSYVT